MPRKNYGRMYWRPEIFLMKGHWKGECGTKKISRSPYNAQKELRTHVLAAGNLSNEGALEGRMRN